MNELNARLKKTLADVKAAGTHKQLRYLTTPMSSTVKMEGKGEVLVFCSNNYLGLADHPEVIEAGIEGLERYGAGTASVRFICGTFDCHRELEERIARFMGTEAALSFVSCWNANEGLMTNLVQEGDLIVSDELNHASIIDAIRLARQATRKVYKHSNLDELDSILKDNASAKVKVVVTDGVFSMEGDVAKLPEIVAVCRKHDATLVVDDSHGTGVLGKHGKGVHEHFGLPGHGPQGVDIFTSTLGKALGGAAGGFVAGSKDLVDFLIQRSRTQLFTNALPATVACSASKALEILEREPERVARLQANVEQMRSGLRKLGYHVLESATAILPIIVGETATAISLSNELLELGVFVIGFGFPVVPEGKARLRVQMSAAHTPEQIERALAAFAKLRAKVPDLKEE